MNAQSLLVDENENADEPSPAAPKPPSAPSHRLDELLSLVAERAKAAGLLRFRSCPRRPSRALSAARLERTIDALLHEACSSQDARPSDADALDWLRQLSELAVAYPPNAANRRLIEETLAQFH